jgi:hypothetical protein
LSDYLISILYFRQNYVFDHFSPENRHFETIYPPYSPVQSLNSPPDMGDKKKGESTVRFHKAIRSFRTALISSLARSVPIKRIDLSTSTHHPTGWWSRALITHQFRRDIR